MVFILMEWDNDPRAMQKCVASLTFGDHFGVTKIREIRR
jgi:hypothetical protein